MTLLALDVEWDKLAEAVWTSAVIGLAILLIAAGGVAASLRAQDARGGGASAAVYGLMTVVAVMALVAIVALGIWVIAS